MNQIYRMTMLLPMALLLVMCTPTLPGDATDTGTKPSLSPDYADITIPRNIAPLNFAIDHEGTDYRTRLYNNRGDELVVGGRTIDVAIDDWRDLTAEADTVYAQVYVKSDRGWQRYAPVYYAIAEDIDPYVSYRLIEPSFVNYEVMRICQRNLTTFDEDEIMNTCAYSDEENGQCINCHNYQNYNADGNMQLHIRGNNGGTLIVRGGKVTKVNLKTDQTISPGVYPAWHPTLPLIAYSTNTTTQNFHNVDPNRIEVYDTESELILYDTESGSITKITGSDASLANSGDRASGNAGGLLETFPAWSPDGTSLYYAVASIPDSGRVDQSKYIKDHYSDIKYDIMRRPFDMTARTFGQPDTVYAASVLGRSALLPRVSPDGRYLLFSEGRYGTFHIWHHDADLMLMDLTEGSVAPLEAVNSDDTESYHSWSSNGRWIVLSSRRGDSTYTRLYIAYFDADGNAHKPFVLPQRSPEHDQQLYKSYNVPELMVAPVNSYELRATNY